MSIRDIKDFVAVDFETATNNRMICQVGVTIVENLKIIGTYSRLIQPPENKYDKGCVNVHHITPEDTESISNFAEAWIEFRHLFHNRIIVAHNAAFDEDALRNNLDYYNIYDGDIPKFECTYCIYYRSLEDLCVGFGLDCDGHHDAGFDSKCCAQFFINYINGVQPDFTNPPKPKAKKKSYIYNYAEHEQLSGDVLKKDLSNADPNNPFYDKKVVITGVFPVKRPDLARKLKEMGADVNTSISPRTNYVIMGESPGWKKVMQIDEYNKNGGNIKTIKWEELQALITIYT